MHSMPSRPTPRSAHATPLRAALLLLILLSVLGMALLRHAGAVALPNLLGLVLVGLIYAFVRLEPPSRRADGRDLRLAS